jgi:chemotaxis signal transduction protein
VDPLGGPNRTLSAEPATRLLLVGRIGAQRYAWPAASVVRVLPMAAVSRVADLPVGVAGLIDVHGEVLAVVDPRPRLGLPPQAAHPEQHLLLLTATERFLLWVDCVETIVAVDADAFEELEAENGIDAPLVTRIDGQLVQVLSPTVFDPGHVVLSARGPR